MPKVLFAVSSDIYVRNYLRTDALSFLRKEFSVDIIADSNLALSDEISTHPDFKGYFALDSRAEVKHHLLFNLLMWRYRRKSRTFLYRWLRNSQWHLIRREGSLLSWAFSALAWLARAARNPHGLRIPLLANRVVFPLASRALQKSLPLNIHLKHFVATGQYDLVIFPSAAFDSTSVDLTRLGRIYNVPTLCLIDNWDNLTSKTVFWEKPDFLGVWGEQASEQAQSIHGFLPEQIRLLGTPRFDSYFEIRERPTVECHYDFPYILFVGSAMPFDEIGTLQLLDRIVSEHPEIPTSLRVVYRPHPWQQKRNSPAIFNPTDFSHVTMDLQMKTAFDQGLQPERTEPGFQPSLEYYPSLLKGARAVVGPLTTMLFEASLCLRPVVALSYFDGFHPNTSKRYFIHFEGMDKVPGFEFCEQPSRLPEMVIDALNHEEIPPEFSDSETSFFLFRNTQSYSQRLSAVASELIRGNDKISAPTKP